VRIGMGANQPRTLPNGPVVFGTKH
jgi:hypothetical protein